MRRRLATFGIALLLLPTLAAADMEKGEPSASGPAVVRLAVSPGTLEPRDLELRPGRYIFMVTNQGVDHPIDFVLKRVEGQDAEGKADPRPVRGARLTRLIRNGETSSTPVVDLKPGSYAYVSPLNNSPECSLIVR